MHPNVPTVLLSTIYSERFESTDESITVCAIGGDLQICIVGPNGVAYISEILSAPVAPLTCTARLINPKGLQLEFRPQAGCQYWIER